MNIPGRWALILVGVCGVAVSAELTPAAAAPMIFQKVDANHDGKLSVQVSRAAEVRDAHPGSPATGPGGSAGAQHVPERS